MSSLQFTRTSFQKYPYRSKKNANMMLIILVAGSYKAQWLEPHGKYRPTLKKMSLVGVALGLPCTMMTATWRNLFLAFPAAKHRKTAAGKHTIDAFLIKHPECKAAAARRQPVWLNRVSTYHQDTLQHLWSHPAPKPPTLIASWQQHGYFQ